MNTDYVCDGRCCERFFFPLTPEDLATKAGCIERGEETYKDGAEEFLTIANMLIYLEPDDKPNEETGDLGAWYTCKNWDTETRRCMIYETRPMMCRGYPYGKECTSCGSTCGTTEDWYEKEKAIKLATRESGGISFDEVASRVIGEL